MTRERPSFQLLYVSQLAPGCGFGVVKNIGTIARQHSRAHGLTGALLFDGERFCQLIEGDEVEVRTLMRRIETDPRHVAVLVLAEGPAANGRLMQRWVSGYCEPGELERLGGPAHEPLRNGAALDAFVAVLGRADVE